MKEVSQGSSAHSKNGLLKAKHGGESNHLMAQGSRTKESFHHLFLKVIFFLVLKYKVFLKITFHIILTILSKKKKILRQKYL